MKKRKWFAALLTATLVLSACGGGGSSTGSETKAGNGDQGDMIRIGGIAPLTGSVAIYGQTASNAAKLAFDEINETGGILGKKVEYVVYDDKADTTEAVTAYQRLMDEGIVALLGAVTSKSTLAVAEASQADQLPIVTPTSTQEDITIGKPNVFRACFTDPYQGVVLAKLAKEKVGAKTAAVLTNNSSDYSDGVSKAFVEHAKELGIDVVSQEGYGEGDKDFRSQLTKLLSLEPDVLVIPDYYEQVALITTQARELGLKSTFIGPDGWDGVLKTLDASQYEALEGSYFTNHFSIEDTTQKVKDFIEAYHRKYNEDPSAFSALAYDAAYMLKQAIEEAGSTDSSAVVEALKNMKFEGVTGKLTFDENNNPIKTCTIMTIESGAYRFDSVME